MARKVKNRYPKGRKAAAEALAGITGGQDYLVPANGNYDSPFWRTPDEPVDPRDCDRWPDSPWCGGQPFSRIPFSYEPSIVADECNIGIELGGTVFFTKMPPVQFVFRKPECRNPPDDLPKSLPPAPSHCPAGTTNVTINWAGHICHSEGQILRLDLVLQSSANWVDFPPESTTNVQYLYYGKAYGSDGRWHTLYYARWQYYRIYVQNVCEKIPGTDNFRPPIICRKMQPRTRILGGVVSIDDYQINDTVCGVSIPQDWRVSAGGGWSVSESDYEPDNNFLPPPNNPTKPIMNCCCPESLDLLKLINKKLGEFPANATLYDTNEEAPGAQSQSIQVGSVAESISKTIERVEKLSKIIGIDLLPITVPENLAEPPPDGIIDTVIGWLTPDQNRKIDSLLEYHIWFLDQFSAAMGNTVQTIEIEDADLTEEGNQSKKIVIPDISTALKELIMLQMQTYKVLGLDLDINLKTLMQAASIMRETARVGAEVDEIVDFLDYPTEDAERMVPVQVDVPQGEDLTQEELNDLGRLLKTAMVAVKYQNWSGDRSLSDFFLQIMSGRGGGS